MISSIIAKRVIAAIGDDSYFEDSWTLFHVETDNARKHYSAMSQCKFDENAHVIVSIPTIGTNIYVTISEGDPGLVRRVMSTLEDIEMESSVHLGNVALLADPDLTVRGIYGVILLSSDIFNALEYVPNTLTVDKVKYTFLSFVFLTAVEHEIWKKSGHDALMKHFFENKKDVIQFGEEIQ